MFCCLHGSLAHRMTLTLIVSTCRARLNWKSNANIIIIKNYHCILIWMWFGFFPSRSSRKRSQPTNQTPAPFVIYLTAWCVSEKRLLHGTFHPTRSLCKPQMLREKTYLMCDRWWQRDSNWDFHEQREVFSFFFYDCHCPSWTGWWCGNL